MLHQRLGWQKKLTRNSAWTLRTPKTPFDSAFPHWNPRRYLSTQTQNQQLRCYIPCTNTTVSTLTDENLSIPRKLIRRHLQIQRSRPLSNPATDIVVTSMAGAKPAVIIPCSTNGYASQMRANSQNHQPLGLQRAIVISLFVPKLGEGYTSLRSDLGWGTMPNEDRLSAPFDRDGLSRGYRAHVEFSRC